MNTLWDHLPEADGFYMPAEFAPHEGTVIIWPVRPGSFGKNQAPAKQAFVNVIKVIAQSERVYVAAGADHLLEAQQAVGAYAQVLEIESDDAWARDTAPTFVTDGVRVRGISWRFNAWGGLVDGLYASWERDDKMAAALCEQLRYPCYDAGDFVLEGGSVHSDGAGTLLVTKSCLLSAGRNPHLSREEIEAQLCAYLGARKILWLPRGIYQDETNEHVDNVCAFTAPGHVVLAWTDDHSDPQYPLSVACLNYLEANTDAYGRKMTVHKLPIPSAPVCVSKEDWETYEFEEGEDMREPGERLAASYVNFYFCNHAVLVPQFGGKNSASDRLAIQILSALCPDRQVIGIEAEAILKGGGNIHCITQQIPKGVPL